MLAYRWMEENGRERGLQRSGGQSLINVEVAEPSLANSTAYVGRLSSRCSVNGEVKHTTTTMCGC